MQSPWYGAKGIWYMNSDAKRAKALIQSHSEYAVHVYLLFQYEPYIGYKANRRTIGAVVPELYVNVLNRLHTIQFDDIVAEFLVVYSEVWDNQCIFFENGMTDVYSIKYVNKVRGGNVEYSDYLEEGHDKNMLHFSCFNEPPVPQMVVNQDLWYVIERLYIIRYVCMICIANT